MRATSILATVLALVGVLVWVTSSPSEGGSLDGGAAGAAREVVGDRNREQAVAHGHSKPEKPELLETASAPVERSVVLGATGANPALQPAVTGTLVHQDGTPSSQTRVVLVQPRSPDSRSPKEIARTRTGEHGEFSFQEAPEGLLQVLAHENAPGMLSLGRGAESSRFEAPEKDLQLVLGGSHRQSFHVVDSLERPIAEFKVLLKQTEHRPGLRDSWMMRGAAGKCSPRVHPGTFTLRVEADGYETLSQVVVLEEDSEPLRFLLEQFVTIRGTVYHRSGLPAAARVRVDSEEGEWGVRCDRDGRFELSSLLPGDLRVRTGAAWASGAMLDHLPTSGDTYTLEPGEVLDLALVLPRGAVVEGTVLSDGGPADRVRIQGKGLHVDVPIEAGGHFLVDGLGPGTYHVTSLHGEDAVDTIPLVLTADQMCRVVLGGELQNPMEVHGRVRLPTGEPSGADLYLIAPDWPEGQRIVQESTTGLDGSFRLEPVERGTYRLVAVQGEEWAGEVVVSDDRSPLDLELVPCGILRVSGDSEASMRCRDEAWRGLSVLRFDEASTDRRFPWPEGAWEFGFKLHDPVGIEGRIVSRGSIRIDVIAGASVDVQGPVVTGTFSLGF